ncbi:MAG: hypothetical protein K2X27_03790 [Candidatus Obscuribacterales bacterium]|nr:hypothetical protein [Candidatus Obscuribacterales bacterium]
MSADRLYAFIGVFVVGYFGYVCWTGGEIFDFGPAASKPSGPQQRFHK